MKNEAEQKGMVLKTTLANVTRPKNTNLEGGLKRAAGEILVSCFIDCS